MEAVLANSMELTGTELSEIGTGSGFMAQYFAERVGPAGRVDAVDVLDQRKVTNGFAFHQVSDTCLPFDDASYDVVITNHVIEHVGDRAAQLHHLQEVKRVLRPDGCV